MNDTAIASDDDRARAALRILIEGVNVEGAVALDAALERAVAGFETEHRQLVRDLCGAENADMDARSLVHAAFLGFVLARLEASNGRERTIVIVSRMLEQFEFARTQMEIVLRAAESPAPVEPPVLDVVGYDG